MKDGCLVLSLFPGIDLLGRAFEETGFCVVRGPDVIFGGDIRGWHVPAERFDGVIGGPPCQCFSQLRRLMKTIGLEPKFGNLIPEFERCVSEAQPSWFVMENVTNAPSPQVDGYQVSRHVLIDWKCGGKTKRRRAFCFGGLSVQIDQNHWPSERPQQAVTSNVRIPQKRHIEKARGKGGVFPGDGIMQSIPIACALQGLPQDCFDDSPYKVSAVRKMLGNGVPMAMGRAVAKAVKEAMEHG